MKVLLLDGPMGTCLGERGIDLSPPLWSARALQDAPETVAAIHRAYADAGADVHTANSFRTQPLQGSNWTELLELAVSIARKNTPDSSRVAGSMAPIEDCYRPDLSPPNPRELHHMMAQALAWAKVDLILCETFPHPTESLIALEEALKTGLECWLSLTAGPNGELLTVEQVLATARQAADLGAALVAINCSSIESSKPFVEAFSQSDLPFGVYANAGKKSEGYGWSEKKEQAALAYAMQAEQWLDAGAAMIGSCCGTSPAHTRALRELIDGRD